jgi:hypothetical protein
VSVDKMTPVALSATDREFCAEIGGGRIAPGVRKAIAIAREAVAGRKRLK